MGRFAERVKGVFGMTTSAERAAKAAFARAESGEASRLEDDSAYRPKTWR